MGVMSLGRHHRQSATNHVVLDRLCFAAGVQVVGGASKLLKRCVEWAATEGHEAIITWSDNRWSAGKIYQTLGFTLDEELDVDYSYVDLRNGRRLSKQSQKKSASGCPADKTETEWAFERGLAKIWDCGKKRWKFDLG